MSPEEPLPALRAPLPLGDDDPPQRRDVLWAFLAALALLSAFAWVRDLWDADEGRYASVALDMKRFHDFVTPREDGMRFMDKPPLVYWMANGAYAVLGATPFAARLPCIIAGATLAALALLFSAAWVGTRRAAWLSAMVAATSLAGMGLSRTVTMDMPLAACVAGALYAGWRSLTSPSWKPRAGLGVAIGLGLLAKGPLVVAATGVVAIAWGIAGVSWKRLLRIAASPLAVSLAILIAAPWYALCERANPGYLEHFLLYEHVRRYSEAGHRDFAPFWLYAAVMPLFLLPWTHLIVKARMRKVITGGLRGPAAAERFAWAWTLSLLLFYSVGRNRLFTYALPAVMPLFVLAGTRLAFVLSSVGGAARRLGAWCTLQGVVAAGIGALLASQIAVTGHFTIAGRRILPIGEPRLTAAGWPLLIGALPLLLAPLTLRFARSARARTVALTLSAAALWWGVDVGAARVDALRSPRALAHTLVQERGPNDLVVCLDLLPQGLRFYEDLFVSVAGKQPEIVPPWSTLDGQGVLLTEIELSQRWNSSQRVVLVAREKKAQPYLARGGRLLASGLSGAQRADLMVIENRRRPK